MQGESNQPRPSTGESVGSGTTERIVSVLDGFAMHGPMSASQAAMVIGLPRPTMYRTVAKLASLGVLTETSTGEFVLGMRPRIWGERAIGTRFSLERAQRILDELCLQTQESAQLFIRDGDSRLCIAVSEPEIGLRDSVPLGARLPISLGSGGRVFRAFSNGPVIGVATGEGPLLEAVRAQGWAASVEERAAGVASVSAPVMQDSELIAVVGVSGPAPRFGDAPRAAIAKAVVAAASKLSSAGER